MGHGRINILLIKLATEEGVNRNDLTVTDLLKNATQSDGKLNIEPSLLGLPDYAQNLKISADGKEISYDVIRGVEKQKQRKWQQKHQRNLCPINLT